jgi:hypothetical protein
MKKEVTDLRGRCGSCHAKMDLLDKTCPRCEEFFNESVIKKIVLQSPALDEYRADALELRFCPICGAEWRVWWGDRCDHCYWEIPKCPACSGVIASGIEEEPEWLGCEDCGREWRKEDLIGGEK